MQKLFTLAAAVIAALTLSACAMQGEELAAAYPDARGVADVAFEPHHGVPIVPVLIENGGPYYMAIDTGSSQTAITPAMSQQLRLDLVQGGDTVYVLTASRPTVTQFRGIDSLQLGGARWGNVRVTQRSLPQFRTQVPWLFGGDSQLIDGIMGINLFSGGVLTIDYPGKRVTFEPGAALSDEAPHTVRATLTPTGLLSVPVAMGDAQLQMIVDTGSSVGFAVGVEQARELMLYDLQPTSPGETAEGNVRRYLATPAQRPVLAGYTLPREPISVVEFPQLFATSSVTAPRAEPAMVGAQILRRFVVRIDYDHRLVQLLK